MHPQSVDPHSAHAPNAAPRSNVRSAHAPASSNRPSAATPHIVVPRRPGLIVALVCGAVGLLGVAYLVGRWEGQGEADRARQAVASLEQGRAEQTKQLQGTIDRLRVRVERLEARRALHRAVLALEDDNFGIARSEVAEAVSALQKTSPVEGSDLARVARDLGNVELSVAAGAASGRVALEELARRLDVALRAE